MHPDTVNVLSQSQLAALKQRLGAGLFDAPPLPDEARDDISWARWVAGRLMVIEQIDHAGQRLAIVVPCGETSARALTAIEGRIARLAGQALSNKEIGFRLHMSQTAVENHLSRALRKLGMPDRIALARLYTQLEAAGRA